MNLNKGTSIYLIFVMLGIGSVSAFESAEARASVAVRVAQAESAGPTKKIIVDSQKFDDFLFSKNDFGQREGARTDGAMVVKNGQILYEKYARGFNSSKKHILWSVSKTVTALLYGVAVSENRVKLDQSICDFIKVPRPEQCQIKIRDLISWTTGIRWAEEYEGTSSPKESSVIAMLYGEGRNDMAAFVLAQPLSAKFKPGEVWRYSSGDTILASKVLAAIFKNQNLRDVFEAKIFKPLDIKNWSCESDGTGTLAGAYYFYLTVPGLARIGELLLNEGRYKNKVIVPKNFIDYMRASPVAFNKNRLDSKDGNISGSSLWLNEPGGSGLSSPWPDTPRDAFAGLGHWGQYLLVIPSQKTVAVRVGDTRDHSVGIAKFASEVSHLIGGVP